MNPQVPWTADVDGRITDFSGRWLELTGLTREEALGEGWQRTPHLDDLPRMVEVWTRSVESGEPFDIEHRIRLSTGEFRWMRSRAFPRRDDAGRVVRWYGTTEDIHDRKVAEERLKLSEATLRAFYDNSPLCMGIVEPTADDVLHIYDNAATRRFFGVEPGTTAGHMASQMKADPEVVSLWLSRYRQSDSAGGPVHFEHEYRSPTGPRWLSVTVSPLGLGPSAVGRFCYIAEDITDRKRSEAEREETQKTLFTLVEQCPFGIYIVDDEFRIASVNAGSQDAAFANVRPLIGRPFAEAMRIIWPEPVAADCINTFRHTLATGEPYSSRDFVSPRADTDQTEGYEWELHRITLPGGRHGVVCYYFDATRLGHAERELREAEGRLRTMADNAPMLIWQTDETGATFLNRHYLDFFDRTADELTGMGWAEFLHPDDAEGYVAAYRSAFDHRERYEYTCRFRRHDGEYRWLLSIGSPLHTADGAFAGFVGCSLDVTDTKRAEERQRLLSEASVVLLATDDLDDMLRGVFDKIAPHFALDSYFNFMVDETWDSLTVGVVRRYPRRSGPFHRADRVRAGRLRERGPDPAAACACHIQQSDDPKVRLVKSLGIRLYACNPLLAGGNLLGTLSFASRSRDEFDASEMEFLKTVCQYVTAAYERMRLIRRLREEDRRKDEFLAMLAARATQSVGTDSQRRVGDGDGREEPGGTAMGT